MKIAICDDNPQDIEKIKRYTVRMIEYANEYEFFNTPKSLLESCTQRDNRKYWMK